jgi:hypothetical protein
MISWRTDRSILKVIVLLFGSAKLVLRLQNWLYRLASARDWDGLSMGELHLISYKVL